MFRIYSSAIPQLAREVREWTKLLTPAHCMYGWNPFYTKPSSWNYSRYVRKSDSSPSGTDHESEPPCKQYTTLAKIFNNNSPRNFGSGDKVSIVGLDDVGIAIVYTLLAKGITNNICMIDMNEDIMQGEHLDLQSSALFLNNPRIQSSKDPSETRDSKVCIITSGTFKGREETYHDYVVRSAGIVRAIVAPLAKYSPNAIYIVASDPVDVLSYATWRMSGIPKQRVIGTGTLIDTARFRYLLSDKLGIAPESCDAYIIGEHGETNSVPVWSNVSVAGLRLMDLNPQIGSEKDPEMWHELYKDAVKTDVLVRQLKGTVSWSVGLAVAEICKAIFSNLYTVLPVSTLVKGEHAIRDEVFLSLPCVIGRSGVSTIVRQNLTDHESSLLLRGADNISHLQTFTHKLIHN